MRCLYVFLVERVDHDLQRATVFTDITLITLNGLIDAPAPTDVGIN